MSTDLADPIARLQAAVGAHRAGRLDEAEQQYRAVLAHEPENPNALHLLGVVYRQRGQPEAAAALITQALQYAPTLADAHANLGNVYSDMQMYEPAVQAYDNARKLGSRGPDADRRLVAALEAAATVHLAAGRTGQGRQFLERALAEAPDRVEIIHALLPFYVAEDRLHALTMAARAWRLRPDRAGFRLVWDLCNRVGEDLEPARAYLATQPEDPFRMLAVGNALRRARRGWEAEALYRAAMDIEPRLPFAAMRLACLMLEQGRIEAADQWLRLAEQGDPGRVRSMQFGRAFFRRLARRPLPLPPAGFVAPSIAGVAPAGVPPAGGAPGIAPAGVPPAGVAPAGVPPAGMVVAEQPHTGSLHTGSLHTDVCTSLRNGGPSGGPSATQRRVIVFSACDGAYFERFASALLASAHRNAGVACCFHLHVVNPPPDARERVAAYREMLDDVPIALSTETIDVSGWDDERRRTWFACARFRLLPHLMEAYEAPILMLDADMLVLRDLGALIEAASAGDVAAVATERHVCEPWNWFWADVVFYNVSDRALAFADLVARYIEHHLLTGEAHWFLDQIALTTCLLAGFADGVAPRFVALPTDIHRLALICRDGADEPPGPHVLFWSAHASTVDTSMTLSMPRYQDYVLPWPVPIDAALVEAPGETPGEAPDEAVAKPDPAAHHPDAAAGDVAAAA